MSCKKGHCPEGMAVCCQECIKKQLGQCEKRCDEMEKQGRCQGYVDETGKRRERKTRRREERRMMAFVIGMALVVLALFAVLCWQEAHGGMEKTAWQNQAAKVALTEQNQNHGYSIAEKKEEGND